MLRSDRLYSGDNGRIHCGAPRCAGATAHATGYTIGGLRVVAIGAKFAADWIKLVGSPPVCETCGQVSASALRAAPRGDSGYVVIGTDTDGGEICRPTGGPDDGSQDYEHWQGNWPI